MGQSPAVCEVLESDAFNVWLPKDREYVELNPNIERFVAGILILGLACFLTMATISRSTDYGRFYATIAVLALIGDAIYFVIFGFSKTRIVRFNRDQLEIGTEKLILLRRPWEEIIEVKKLRNRGYEVFTEQGSCKIWWPSIGSSKVGYSFFLRCTLEAMAAGYAGSDLSKIRLPVDLVDGKSYAYRVPGEPWWLKPFVVSMSVFFVIASITKFLRHEVMDGLFSLPGLLSMWFLVSFTKQTKVLSEGVKIRAENGNLIVDGPKQRIEVLNSVFENRLLPGIKPNPFEGVEKYGSADKWVSIDRRYLYEVSN